MIWIFLYGRGEWCLVDCLLFYSFVFCGVGKMGFGRLLIVLLIIGEGKSGLIGESVWLLWIW